MNYFNLIEKTCRHCKRILPVEDFAVVKNLSSQCRDCRAIRMAPQKRFCKRCGRGITKGQYFCVSCATEHTRQYQREWKRKDRLTQKGIARKLFCLSILSKKITPGMICESCKSPRNGKALHGHHRDYNKPLDVIWLCQPCHTAVHKTL